MTNDHSAVVRAVNERYADIRPGLVPRKDTAPVMTITGATFIITCAGNSAATSIGDVIAV